LGAEETLFFTTPYTGTTIAPGEGKIPVPLYMDQYAEILSFPTVYAAQERIFKTGLKITYTDIAKSELRRYDRRACKPSKLLYSFKRSHNEKVHSAVQICLRKKVGKVTAANIRTPGYIDHLLKVDAGYSVFKDLRSSPSYWKQRQKFVLAMVRQIGKCSFFITLSAAETKWTELKVNYLLLFNIRIFIFQLTY
jgi:hypothetical protein